MRLTASPSLLKGRKPGATANESKPAPEERKRADDAPPHPFKCGNNSLNAADEDARISS
jgi:hypothetical protein